VTSSWFFLSTLNYDARSTTHQIFKSSVAASEMQWWRSIGFFPNKLDWSVGSTTSGSSGQPVSWLSRLVPCTPGEWCLISHRTLWACIFQQKAEFHYFFFKKKGEVRWPYASGWLFNFGWYWCTQFSPLVTMLYLFIICSPHGWVKQA
jgi:hypothetical protein